MDTDTTPDPTASALTPSVSTTPLRGAGAVRPGVDYDAIAQVLVAEADRLLTKVTKTQDGIEGAA